MKKYIIIEYTNGKYGYKSFFELKQYNSVYKDYDLLKESLLLEFIKSYCSINGIDYNSITIIKQ